MIEALDSRTREKIQNAQRSLLARYHDEDLGLEEPDDDDAHVLMGEAAIVIATDYRSGDDLQPYVSDLLADLMYLCDQEGVDYRHAIRQARNHFVTETDAATMPTGR